MHYDFTLFQGSDLELLITLKDSLGATRDLTGQSFRGQAKRSFAQENPDLVFIFEPTNLVNGEFKMKIPACVSATLNIRNRTQLVYDIEMYTENSVERVLMGKIDFDPEVTR